MRILITNDDGILAPGLLVLARTCAEFAQVTVVAPDRERSAASHSLSFHDPLRLEKRHIDDSFTAYALSGTPADCVIVGFCEVMQGNRPDITVTGINRGANLGFDISYSGTASAAKESIVEGAPGLAVSLFGRNPEHYETAAQFAVKVIKAIAEGNLAIDKSTFLNMNVPDLPFEAVKGLQLTHQGSTVYSQDVCRRTDPWGREYRWLYGEMPQGSMEEGSDYRAVMENYVSLTPLHFDCTNYRALSQLAENPFFRS